MAIIKLNYLSKCLMRTVDVDVILPSDTLNMETMQYENYAPAILTGKDKIKSSFCKKRKHF